MEEVDRKRIIKNVDALVQMTDYDSIIDACKDKGILSDVMKQAIEKQRSSVKHAKLFEKITRRGPNAYEILLNICRDLNYMDAYQILKPSSYNGQMNSTHGSNKPTDENDAEKIANSMNNIRIKPLEPRKRVPTPQNQRNTYSKSLDIIPYTDNTPDNIEWNVVKSTKFHASDKLNTYPMSGKCRGIFCFINIINFKNHQYRKGATEDKDNLIHLFRGLGFTVFYYEDVTYADLEKILSRLISSDYLRKTDCFVFGLLSHGEYNSGVTRVLFSDDSIIKVEHIIEKFNNANCPNLLNKPKIFIFPFCRGSKPDKGLLIRSDINTQSDSLRNVNTSTSVPTYSDIVICYATVPGYETHRDIEEGSWYIQSMCEVWSQHAHDTRLHDLLMLVDAKTAGMRTDSGSLQTAATEYRGFYKALFFNPGMYDDVHCDKTDEHSEK